MDGSEFAAEQSALARKIAIAAEPRWETLALAFAGAGVRRAPVKFFFTQRIGTGAELAGGLGCYL
jgi:hypothetical protein